MPAAAAMMLGSVSPVHAAPAPKDAPSATAVRSAVRAHRRAHQGAILAELRALLALPNVASDRTGIRKNAAHLKRMLTRRGLKTQLLENPPHPPVVYGELASAGASSTVVFYAHYDGQPVERARWASDPYRPVLFSGPRDRAKPLAWSMSEGDVDPDWRIYGRSSSDDKGPIVALLAALDALRTAAVPPSVNVKVFLEGEEEAGSEHLQDHLDRHRNALVADAWIFCDGPVHPSGRPQVVFGVRGIVGLGITVYGPSQALHSGHYGNWAPNPAAELIRLLASMRKPDGTVSIEGFHDQVKPVSPAEREALARVPDVETALRQNFLLGRTEGEPARLLERIMQPALNIDGLSAGSVGARAKNAIPDRADAALDFRLVPAQTPDHIKRSVEAHIRARGFRIVHREPSPEMRRRAPRLVRLDWEDGYPSVRTAMDQPISRAVAEIVDAAVDRDIVRVPMLGGSLPLYRFARKFGVPLIIVPTVNHDNNQHAPNENLRLGNLFEGIEIYAALIARLGHAL